MNANSQTRPVDTLSDAEREFLLKVDNHAAIVDDDETAALVNRAVKAEAVRIARLAIGPLVPRDQCKSSTPVTG